MSLGVYLSIKVSGYDPSRVDLIKQAIDQVLHQERFKDEMSQTTEAGEGAARVLAAFSSPDLPVTISSAYKWLPKVQKLFAAAVKKANGSACNVEFVGDPDVPGAAKRHRLARASHGFSS